MDTKNKKASKKIIISVDDEGDCSVMSPPEMEIDEVVDILAAAVEAAAEKSMEEEERKKDVKSAFPWLYKDISTLKN